MPVESGESLKIDWIGKLGGFFSTNVNHIRLNNLVTNVGGKRIVERFHRLLKTACRDLSIEWQEVHSTVTGLNITVSGAVGSGGELVFTEMDLHIERIYFVPTFNYFEILLKAIEQKTTIAFNTYLNSYAFAGVPFEGDEAGKKNLAGATLGSGVGDESKFQSLAGDIKSQLLASGFISTYFLNDFITSYSNMVNEKFQTYKQSAWKAGKMVCVSQGIANGGELI